ncbi:hypothetical protein CXT84_06825 [Akkermansia muciniphila]|nr:hypothetical protein CXT84_06825 [Akkermansia muciniphila]
MSAELRDQGPSIKRFLAAPPPGACHHTPAWRPCLPHAGLALRAVCALDPCFLFGIFLYIILLSVIIR